MPTSEYEVVNCPNCGNIFRKTTWALCQDCKIEMENELSKCTEYIRRNRQTNMAQLVQATGVNEENIVKYIRDSKIFISDVPNLSYPCDLCSNPIRKGNLCLNCRTKLSDDIGKMKHQEQLDLERKRKENQASYKINDRLNKN
jgi:flagellar operon protein (TIGR03826 family)